MLLPQLPTATSLAVIITNHNYEQYLENAIRSVLRQTLLPSEILVVDDAIRPTKAQHITSRYAPYGVRYAHAFALHPTLSRQFGFNLVKSDYVVFLDADDALSREYIRTAQEIISIENADIVYSDLQYFGLRTLRTHFPRDVHPARIFQNNFLHVGCAVRRTLVEAAGAFNCPTQPDYHEDWMFWRRIVRAGCTLKKQSNAYLARIHTSNRSLGLITTLDYYHQRGVQYGTVTMVGMGTPTQDWFFPHEYQAYSKAHNSQHLTRLYGEDALSVRLYPDTNIMPPQSNGGEPYALARYNITGKERILNHVASTTNSDFIFFYNEANPPPIGSVDRLAAYLNHNVCVVQDQHYSPFECTLVMGDIFRRYRYTHCDPKTLFSTEHEKAIVV